MVHLLLLLLLLHYACCNWAIHLPLLAIVWDTSASCMQAAPAASALVLTGTETAATILHS